jgi:hypothetical protein
MTLVRMRRTRSTNCPRFPVCAGNVIFAEHSFFVFVSFAIYLANFPLVLSHGLRHVEMWKKTRLKIDKQEGRKLAKVLVE